MSKMPDAYLAARTNEIRDAALRVHLTRLRKEIAPLGLEIATVRGFGHVMQETSA